jgi:TRAP-type C4-dicarboxylate transport system permease small subunit
MPRISKERRNSVAEIFFRRFERLAEMLAFVGMLLLSASIAVVIVDVVGRKTIGFSILGINDITQLLVMGCVCLAMPLTFIREGHVGVEFATDALPTRVLATVKFLVALLCFVFALTLALFSYAQAVLQIGKGDSSLTLSIPVIWYWAPLLIGLSLSAVASLAHTLRYIYAAVRGADPTGAESDVTRNI